MTLDEDLRAQAAASLHQGVGSVGSNCEFGRSAMAGEQEKSLPLLVLPTSCRPLDSALTAGFLGGDLRPDGLPLLLRVDAIEPVELIAPPVEEDQRRAIRNQTIAGFPLGPSGASEVSTCVRANEPALFDFAPMLVAQVRTHTVIMRHSKGYPGKPPRPSSQRGRPLSHTTRGQVCQMVVLLVAWTVADLAGHVVPTRGDVAEALGVRLHRVAA